MLLSAAAAWLWVGFWTDFLLCAAKAPLSFPVCCLADGDSKDFAFLAPCLIKSKKDRFSVAEAPKGARFAGRLLLLMSSFSKLSALTAEAVLSHACILHSVLPEDPKHALHACGHAVVFSATL
jgi:hypothetical protein